MRTHNSRNRILPEVDGGCQTHRALPHPDFRTFRRKRQGIVAGRHPHGKRFQAFRDTNRARFPNLNATGTMSLIVNAPHLALTVDSSGLTAVAAVPQSPCRLRLTPARTSGAPSVTNLSLNPDNGYPETACVAQRAVRRFRIRRDRTHPRSPQPSRQVRSGCEG